MDDVELAGKSDVYASGDDGPTSVLSERVSSLAAAIYAEFERMIQKHGQEVVSGLMPLMVSVLEQLDSAYNDNNEQYVDLELLNDDNEQLLTQYEREKQLRKIAENKYLRVEDEHEQEKQEILKNLEAEKLEKRTLESKIKSLTDHVQRTEERLNEKSRDYNSLHQRHSEMLHRFMERMEKNEKVGRLPVTPGGAPETPKLKRPVLSLENNAMQGLFNSVSQPNLSGSVSPTPQTPNQNTDFKPKKRLGKKNNLSFEDESMVKVNLEDRLSVNMSEEEQVNNGAAQAMSFLEETRTFSTPIETIAELKENSLTQASKGDATSSEHLNQIRVEQTLSEMSSQPSGDSDPSGVKTYNDSDVSHPPVVGVDDVRNLISSPESKSQSINDSMVGELSPDIQAILSSTPELEGTVSLSGNNRSSLDKSSSHDLKGPLELAPAEESVNTNSLFAELANQEPSAIEEIDEGAEISLMGKELESVLKENEELVETKSKLLTLKNDLLKRIEEIRSENEMLKDESAVMKEKMESLSTKGESYEKQNQEIKWLKQELDKSTMALKEANVSAAHRKRFSRVEMARVLMERNQYKERLMELQEAVRWTEMIRASKEKSLELQQKKKSWVWKLFSGLFSATPKRPTPSPVSLSKGSQNVSTGRSPSDASAETPQGVVDSQVERQRLMEKRTRMKQLRASMTSGIPVGRMQAYGWSLPSRYSTEGANDSKGLLSVPVPIYCRPLNVNEPGMKIWCATVVEQHLKDGGSPVGGSVFYADSCRESGCVKDTSNAGPSLEESNSATLWIGSSTHSCSKVTVIDGNSPQKVLECFVLCSSHLLCMTAVPAVSEEDFDDQKKDDVVDLSTSCVHKQDDSGSTSEGQPNYAEAHDSFGSFDKTSDSLSTSELFDPLDIKPRAVREDSGTPSGNGAKSNEESVDQVTTMLATVWFGAQSGCIYIHSGISNWKRCLHSIKLRDSVLSIVHIRRKVLIALADGTVAIFERKPDGQWDLKNYHLLDLGRPHHSIRCMTVVHDHVWCGYRNKIQVINPKIMRIVKSFDAHPRRESQVRQLSCIGDGVWVSIRLDSTLRLYNAHTFHHLQDVDIEPCVSSLIGAGKLGFSFVRITALLLTKDRMWVGTGNGVILSIPLVVAQPESSKSPVTSPVDSGGPGGVVRVYTDTEGKGEQTGSSRFMPYCSMVNAHISFHGHRDSVKFFVTISGCMDKATSLISPKLSSSSVKAEATSAVLDEEKSWLVISGGEGYIDFRTGDNIESGENIGGPEDISPNSKISSAENSHLVVWQVTGN
ncbi:JNK-interacting protein 3-like isoform X2 [Xenia sp. Carnegie-2017]|uniref:JNK-interacting protein 3-like isoform X2 n=1 Tax=Xenia sp. Carnegie-2017 TaxID=2897299 RepID=UPI001F04DEE9|nr:JNK-interacting protein 3-like isoform X2 [Xenia sp. Carnegie-2017]